MNREELLNEIMKTREHLANMEKTLGGCRERWKPKEGEKFFFIDAWNRVCNKNYREISVCCQEYYSTYNCFRTRGQAEAEAEKILVRRMLEDIARRLNKTEKIDWNNEDQCKYFIHFSYWQDKIQLNSSWKSKLSLGIYCLDKSFLDVALEEIGRERLEKYLKSN